MKTTISSLLGLMLSIGVSAEADDTSAFARHWNNLPWEDWWRNSAPYSCAAAEKTSSPWINAGLKDLGGSDPLSLIRYYGNGSYLRYGNQNWEGCTPMARYPDYTHFDPPADPTYYSLGDLEIWIDIFRIAPSIRILDRDDGSRVAMSMGEVVNLMNTYVAPYWHRVSKGKFRVAFRAGENLEIPRDTGDFIGHGTGWYKRAEILIWHKVNYCRCPWRGYPGGLNRIFFFDPTYYTSGSASNGLGHLGLIQMKRANMPHILHEMGHGWMGWPHSFAELLWRPQPGGEFEGADPYSNRLDFMSALGQGLALESRFMGWREDFPPPLAINRYSAGWIEANDVALHVADSGTYRLSRPLDNGDQFLVIHSGRQHAFTTLEVLPERPAALRHPTADVYDPSALGGRRQIRYDGVLVSRYDQSRGTGPSTRFGPALYDTRNPEAHHDVGWGRDDYSVIGDGESRDIGGGVTVSVSRNGDGSYDVAVSGGKIAAFGPWCSPIGFDNTDYKIIYDTGCHLDAGQPNPPEPPANRVARALPSPPSASPSAFGFRDCATGARRSGQLLLAAHTGQPAVGHICYGPAGTSPTFELGEFPPLSEWADGRRADAEKFSVGAETLHRAGGTLMYRRSISFKDVNELATGGGDGDGIWTFEARVSGPGSTDTNEIYVSKSFSPSAFGFRDCAMGARRSGQLLLAAHTGQPAVGHICYGPAGTSPTFELGEFPPLSEWADGRRADAEKFSVGAETLHRVGGTTMYRRSLSFKDVNELTTGGDDGDGIWIFEVRVSGSGSTHINEIYIIKAAGKAIASAGLVSKPNPFNSATVLGYHVSRPGPVRLIIYNLLGQPVRRLVDRYQEAGTHEVRWDARAAGGGSMAAGVYLARLHVPGGIQTRSLLYLK